jgi:hypothetical protein
MSAGCAAQTLLCRARTRCSLVDPAFVPLLQVSRKAVVVRADAGYIGSSTNLVSGLRMQSMLEPQRGVVGAIRSPSLQAAARWQAAIASVWSDTRFRQGHGFAGGWASFDSHVLLLHIDPSLADHGCVHRCHAHCRSLRPGAFREEDRHRWPEAGGEGRAPGDWRPRWCVCAAHMQQSSQKQNVPSVAVVEALTGGICCG